MQKLKLNTFVLSLILMFTTIWSNAYGVNMADGHSNINIKVGNVQGVPKGSTIHASINGHVLTVTFTENLGQVAVEVTTASGAPVDGTLTITPNGIQIYIPLAGDYIVTFTLPNGDVYYGEFTVTD